jgi:hypothetical protein
LNLKPSTSRQLADGSVVKQAVRRLQQQTNALPANNGQKKKIETIA